MGIAHVSPDILIVFLIIYIYTYTHTHTHQPRMDIAHMSPDILIESYEPGHSVAAFCGAVLEAAAASCSTRCFFYFSYITYEVKKKAKICFIIYIPGKRIFFYSCCDCEANFL
jgi:hypothetical protein